VARLSFGGDGLLVVKMGAWLLTGSAAILSDALESIINVVAAAFAVLSVTVAETPPMTAIPTATANRVLCGLVRGHAHPFGLGAHLWESGTRFFIPSRCRTWAAVSRCWSGRARQSVAGGVADQSGQAVGIADPDRRRQACLTDVYTSAGWLIGLGLVAVTGWLWLDGLIACLVGLNIAWTGVDLVRRPWPGS